MTSEFPAGEPRREEVIVHPAHESEARAHTDFALRHWKSFFAAMLSLPFLLVGAGVAAQMLSRRAGEGAGGEEFWTGVLFGPLVILFGVFLFRYPFSTPQTVRLLGIKRSVLAVRTLGVLIAALGAWMLGRGLI